MKRVLLVDYDENHLRQLRRLLEGFEARVEEAQNGVEGLKKIGEENYDVVIASTIIPGLNGFELTRKIRIELGKTKLPVILVSSVYKGAKYKYEALHVYGADYFFEFPLDEKEFFSTLKKYLPEKAPTTTMKMETLHGKPMKEVKEELITTDELFGDILHEVEKEMAQQEEEEEKVEEVEEIVKEEAKPEVKAAAEKAEPEEILKEILEPSRPKKRKAPKEEDLIEKILEETLSGLGEKKKTRPAFKKKEEAEKREVEARAEEVKVEEVEIKEKPAEKVEEKPAVTPAVSEKPVEEIREEAEEIKEEEEPFGPLEEPSVLGEYILLEKISTGGMAEIYKAKKKGVKGFEKIVALKKILPHLAEDEEFIEMFIDEAKVASKLNHPNIAQIYDLGKINGSYFIAMEYVLGKDLKTILRKIKKEKKPLPPIEISSYIVMKIAEALDYAHRKVDENGRPLNIVHRDVSPQNILISYEGEVKLVDFGVAKASIKAHQTIAGSLKGKLLYMSPEQAKGAKNIDGRSDIFSLGTVFYELVTGEKAFLAHSEAEVLDKVRKGSFKPPRSVRPEIPAEVERIIMKAMEPNPSRRYQRASDMRNDIEKFLLSYKGYIPSARDVAEFMYELFEEEIKKAGIDVQILKAPRREVPEEKKVMVEKEEEEKPVKKPVKVPSFGLEAEEGKAERKTRFLPVVLGAILLLALIGGGYFFLSSKGKTHRPKPPAKEEMAQKLPPPPAAGEEKPSEEVPPEQTPTEKAQQPQPSVQPPQPAASRPSPPAAKKPQAPKPRLKPVQTKKTTPKAKPKPAPKPAPQPPKSQPSPPPRQSQPTPVQKKPEQKPQTPSQTESKPEPTTSPLQQKSKPRPAPPQPKPVPPKPQIKEGQVVPYSLLDSRPRPVKMVSPRKPSFPKLSGIVFLSVLVGPDGRVEKVKLIRGIHPRYDDAAVKAVKKWKFTSPTKEGKRVRTWTTVTIKY